MNWRMPTKEELYELIDFLQDKDVYWSDKHVEHNGVMGILYSDEINDDYFFIPGGGYWGPEGHSEEGECWYWSSSLGSSGDAYAQSWAGGLGFWHSIKRWAGLLVRPVVNEDTSN